MEPARMPDDNIVSRALELASKPGFVDEARALYEGRHELDQDKPSMLQDRLSELQTR